METIKDPDKKLMIEIRREVKKYYGIEYALILMATDDNMEEKPMAEKDKFQWWNLEYTENTGKLVKNIGGNFLWASTIDMHGDIMQDKYHNCEITAVSQINWLMGKYPWERAWWIAKEIKYLLIATVVTMPDRVVYGIKKVMGKQA